MWHGGDYNPDQWLDYPKVLEKDIELMKKSGCNVMSVGIFAWSKLEPQESIFEFEWLAYDITGDEKYKKAGIHQNELYREALYKTTGLEHHDIGFLYSLSAVAGDCTLPACDGLPACAV